MSNIKNTTVLHERIHGGVAGAVIGDALGSLTETASRRQIRDNYGWVDDFREFKFKPFGQDRISGAWTDDSSLVVYIMQAIVEHDDVTVEVFVDALAKWSRNPSVARHAGPTTRSALDRIAAGEQPSVVGLGDDSAFAGISNGGAMKAAPAGWLNPNNVQAAAQTAALICVPTHNTNIAIAGAAAIAAACSIATVENVTIDDIVAAAVEGARIGDELGLSQGREIAGPSISRRIEFAVWIANQAVDFEIAVKDIAEVVGSSLSTADSVPAAIGLFVAASGDLNQTVIGAANIGDDTDTVGTMAGAIAGTYSGVSRIRTEWYEHVSTVNQLKLAELTTQFIAATRNFKDE